MEARGAEEVLTAVIAAANSRAGQHSPAAACSRKGASRCDSGTGLRTPPGVLCAMYVVFSTYLDFLTSTSNQLNLNHNYILFLQIFIDKTINRRCHFSSICYRI